MNLITKGIDEISRGVKKHLPFILSCIATGGAIATPVIVFMKKDDISDAFDNFKKAWEEAEGAKEKALVVIDEGRQVAKEVAGPVITTGVTVACIAGAQHENTKRIGIALTALGVSQAENKGLKETAQELLGKKKVQTIEEKHAEKKYADIDENSVDMYDDADIDRDCIFIEDNSEITWRDNFYNVQNAIMKMYDQCRNNNERVSLTALFSILNETRYNNKIRCSKMCKNWEFIPDDYARCEDIEDFMQIVPAGFTDGGTKKFLIKSTPRLSEELYGGISYDDALCGDGAWQG